MIETFQEINELSQFKTAIAGTTIAKIGYTPIEGRLSDGTKQIEKLWDFMVARNWIIANSSHWYARKRGFNGWTIGLTREIYVKPSAGPVGYRLQVALHEAVHALEMDEFGLNDFRNDPALGGSLGAEIRAETASCVVLSEITSLSGIVEHAADYIGYQNYNARYRQNAHYPHDFKAQIMKMSDLLLSIMTS